MSTVGTVLSLGAFGALAAGSAVLMQHLQGDANAMKLYAVGAINGTLLMALVIKAAMRFRSSSSAKASAASAETPRALLRSVSKLAVDANFAPPPPSEGPPSRSTRAARKSIGGGVIAEVEYSVDDYESMRQKKKAATPSKKSQSPSRKAKSPAKSPAKQASTPDSGKRRSSARTPKGVSKFDM